MYLAGSAARVKGGYIRCNKLCVIGGAHTGIIGFLGALFNRPVDCLLLMNLFEKLVISTFYERGATTPTGDNDGTMAREIERDEIFGLAFGMAVEK